MSDPPADPVHGLPLQGPTASELVAAMVMATPWAAALGFRVTSVGADRVTLTTPYREELIGNTETGVISGGVITALLDHVCGAAVMAAMTERQSIATLDLRIDYMRGAIPGRDIHAEAHCYKITRSVAFVRAVAFDTSADDPVANASGAFMIGSNGGRRMGANLRPPR